MYFEMGSQLWSNKTGNKNNTFCLHRDFVMCYIIHEQNSKELLNDQLDIKLNPAMISYSRFINGYHFDNIQSDEGGITKKTPLVMFTV